MSHRLIDTARVAYAAATATGDLNSGAQVVLDLMGAGVDPWTVASQVVAVEQRSIGKRWDDGAWTVAQERAASTVATRSVQALESAARSNGGVYGLHSQSPRIVVACPELEWHELPARMVGLALVTQGVDAEVLGAAAPPGAVVQSLQAPRVMGLLVSCTMSQGLPGSRELFEAARLAELPSVAGGAAFGLDARRALFLGASGWANDPLRLRTTMEDLPVASEPSSEQKAAWWESNVLRGRWAELSELLGADLANALWVAVAANEVTLLSGQLLVHDADSTAALRHLDLDNLPMSAAIVASSLP